MTDAQVRPSHDAYRPGGVRAVGLLKPTPLRGPTRLEFHASLWFELIRSGQADPDPWKVTTHGYAYHIRRQDDSEVILFHWHPKTTPNVPTPHLHVGTGELDRRSILTSKAHLPSGRVALEQVISLLVTELDVVPRRDDWADVLEQSLAEFKEHRRWV